MKKKGKQPLKVQQFGNFQLIKNETMIILLSFSTCYIGIWKLSLYVFCTIYIYIYCLESLEKTAGFEKNYK
jgi:hypothetical protein